MSRALASTNVIYKDTSCPATVIYSPISGKILHIEPQLLSVDDDVCVKYHVESLRDVSPLVVMPGLVDAHVHLNEPGRTEWEGFATGTQAAASGGVTTVIDMPLNAIPPTTTIANFYAKLNAAKGQTWVDTGFWGGLVPDNLDHLVPLIKAGVRGFKGFMMDSGVNEFPMITPEYINNALKTVKDHSTILLFHAEMDPETSPHVDIDDCLHKDTTSPLFGGISQSSANLLALSPKLHPVEPLTTIDDLCLPSKIDPREYSSFLASRPDSFECTAIRNIINCMKTQPTTKCHIVHLATQEALPLIVHAQNTLKLPLSAETCFHYLSLKAEEIPAGATQFKCCPPIRSDKNRLKLWDALRDGVISSVVSDHSPCTPELKGLKRGDFFKAWGGISSVGFGLPLLWTVGRNQYGENFEIKDIAKWCCQNTAKQVGLSNKKGHLDVGMDADFVIFNPDYEFEIDNSKTYFKNKLTAFNGKKMKGRVTETILRGRSIYALGKGVSDVPIGQLLLEPRFD